MGRTAMTTVYTVGYERMTFPELDDFLNEQGVEVLVDIRSYAGSFHVKRGYSSKELERARGSGRYRWEPRLGGKYTRPDGIVFPGQLTRHPQWEKGLGELMEVASAKIVCVMCKEDDPVHCHRRRWVQGELEKRGVKVVHLRRAP